MLIDYFLSYLKELYVLTTEMAPYLILGFLFAGLLHIFFKKERIARILGSKKIKSSVYASLIGVPLPLCSCGVIPTGVSIYKSGASKGSTVSFLISTPQTGVDSIFATYSMLGLPFAIIRPFIAFISGIVGGAITNMIDKKENTEHENVFLQSEDKKYKNPVWGVLHYAFVESLQDIAKWLIIGLMLAALLSLIIPPDFFQKYISNDFLSMIVILAVAVPLYICATGSIPIAAVLMMKGISPGAALVFLMAGPATNAATITVLGKVIGKRALFGYLFAIIGSAFLSGLMIDNFLPREWFIMNIGHHQHDMNHGLPSWIGVASSILLGILLINIYLKKFVYYFRFKTKLFPDKKVSKYNVNNEYLYYKFDGKDLMNNKDKFKDQIIKIVGIESVELIDNEPYIRIKASSPHHKRIKDEIESLGNNNFIYFASPNYLSMPPVKIYVKGMSCSHCKANVEKSIKAISTVEKVNVDLDHSIVEISGENLNLNDIKSRIEEVGYEYGGIVPA